MTPAESLSEVMRLGALATPGLVQSKTRDDGTEIVSFGDWRMGPHAQGDIELPHDDVLYLVASANYLRTHGARIAELEADRADYVKAAAMLAIERAEFRIRAERAEAAGQRVTDAFRAMGTADGFLACNSARMECESAMDALDTALATSKGADAGEGG